MRAQLMIAATLLATFGPPPARARADSYIDCSSYNYGRNYCRADTRGGVWLDRQYSYGDGQCEEGRTWGWDDRGVWVDRGCRARFRVAERKGGKDNTAALVGGLLIGGLILGALASQGDDKSSKPSPSGDSGAATDACSNEAMSQAARYGRSPRIDRITSTRPDYRGGYTVDGYVTAQAGPRAVTYSFQCAFDGRYARVTLN
ncbi:hypothetical protein C5708_16025 [Caulobacter sp. CCUG 60055]|uniref:DUF3011 domain-containing protein n=1 Tax=Caulobacter sp. CCUG 60055 TaxID=2100090 RepID=UPI001FA7375A|nr:DUF3011 domain-containing protein [Caulobacter sp. CCUG 60055]MBQ1542167.1 DUF3011 domain-containing protein [Caulobacteraceae bacterium]MCI3181755.1 hypothetical protein [Caulobacter sp. CCUG 60055]